MAAWEKAAPEVDFEPSREAFRTVRHHPEDATNLASVGVWALHQDADRELWVGTYTEGLERFDAEGIGIPFPQRDVHLFPAGDSASEPPPEPKSNPNTAVPWFVSIEFAV